MGAAGQSGGITEIISQSRMGLLGSPALALQTKVRKHIIDRKVSAVYNINRVYPPKEEING
jgi:hypothetical protein